jgi:RNA polymerase sigma-70 factor (ECF subfamily)
MGHRTNDEWLSDLRAGDDKQACALEDLRAIVLRGMPYALAGKISQSDPAFGALAEEVAQETLLRVLAHLDSFEGRSQFTTWVQKIAVRQAFSDLRRRRWRDVPLPEMQAGNDADPEWREMPDPQPDPETIAERSDLLRRVNRLISKELTEKQRQAVYALAVQGLPIEIVAGQMRMKPNSLYKLLHDARRRIKRCLEREGLTSEQILSIFDTRTR